MNHLLNVLDGFASILELQVQPRRTYSRRTGGFAMDQSNLSNDARQVGNDIKKTLTTYGKQSISGTGYQAKR